MARRARHESTMGLTRAEIAQSLYGGYASANSGAGTALPPWQALGDDQQEAWFRLLDELGGTLAHTAEASAKGLARLAYYAYTGSDQNFEEQTAAVQLCWEAVVRHFVNLLDFQSDDEMGVAEHEAYWSTWILNKLTTPAQPQGAP